MGLTKIGRWVVLGILGAGLGGAPGTLVGQQVVLTDSREVEDYRLPSWARTSVRQVASAPETEGYEGPTRIRTDEIVRGNLLVLEGTLTLDGVVEGDVVVINGDVVFGPDGWVEGDAMVLGGRMEDRTHVGGGVQVSGSAVPLLGRRWVDERERRERVRPHETEWRSHGDWSDQWRDGRGRAYADFDITGRLGPTYNRTEGLPIALGPRLRVGGAAPLELEGLVILRTATSFDSDIDEFVDDEVGYSVRLEQRLGGDAQMLFGGRLFSVVEDIESWGLSDDEASLASFFLRDDYRDYYDREGWSAFAGVRVRDAGLRFTIDYRDEEYGFRPVADPWTPFDRDKPWRPQPLVAEGDMTSVGLQLSVDLPDIRGPFSGGWFLMASARRGLDGQIARPEHTSVLGVDVPAALFDASDVRYGFVDLRRYNRLGPNNRLDLRFLAGGSLNDRPLPPQFQHAVGGVGSLPGHKLFIGDCGARDVPVGAVPRRGSAAAQDAFANYGCDRFLVFQAEYRGGFGFDWDWDDRDGRDREPDNWGEWEDWDRHGGDFDHGLEWSFFFDAGRGWTLSPEDAMEPRYDTDTLLDAGVGLWIGDLGVLAAVPLDTDSHPVRWFVRFQRRF